jgi:hypothetical protein
MRDKGKAGKRTWFKAVKVGIKWDDKMVTITDFSFRFCSVL